MKIIRYEIREVVIFNHTNGKKDKIYFVEYEYKNWYGKINWCYCNEYNSLKGKRVPIIFNSKEIAKKYIKGLQKNKTNLQKGG